MKWLKHRAVSSGLLGFGLMLGFGLLYSAGPGEAGWARLLWQSGAFGLVFFVGGLLPQSDNDDWPGKPGPEMSDPPFVVNATIGSRVMAGVLGLVCAGGLLISAMGLLGRFKDGTLAFYLALAALFLWLALLCLKAFLFRIQVHDSGLRIRQLLGWTEIPLAGIGRIEPRSPWASFPAMAHAPISALHWTDAEGRQRTILVNLESRWLVHGASLLSMLRDESRGRRNQAAG